jgi:Tol biopolymer transport system component
MRTSMTLGRAVVCLVLGFGALLTASVVPASSEAFPGANGKIAFVRYDEATDEGAIWVMDADGSNPVGLTSGFEDDSPMWSPDGTKIAFQRDGVETAQIWVMDADGSNQSHLVDGSVPSWSPDGSKIVFNRFPVPNTGSGPALFVADADGSNVSQLTTDNRFDRWPSWSPDGTQIAFTRDDAESTATEIWVAGADGSDAVQLTDSGVSAEQSFIPGWSPDGSRIVYTYRTGDQYFVSVMNADGSDQTQLSGPGSYRGRWSPDGTLIAYADLLGADAGIRTMRPDGSGAQSLLVGPFFDPSWQRIATPVVPTTPTTGATTTTTGVPNRAGANGAVATPRFTG